MRGSLKYTRRGGEVRHMRVDRVSFGKEDGTRQESNRDHKKLEKSTWKAAGQKLCWPQSYFFQEAQ